MPGVEIGRERIRAVNGMMKGTWYSASIVASWPTTKKKWTACAKGVGDDEGGRQTLEAPSGENGALAG
jgi:hypothetical protein